MQGVCAALDRCRTPDDQEEVKKIVEKVFKKMPEDIRLSKFQMDRIQTRSSQRAIHACGKERFQLPSLTKASIFGSMPMTLDKETKSHVRATYRASK